MDRRAQISAEIKGISTTVSSVAITNVFEVNADYFTTVTDVILAKIAAENAVFNANALVPDGYFENLPQNILKKIREDENEVKAELTKLSPLVESIGKNEIYSLPQGYFAQLVFSDESEKKPAKIISINKTKSFLKYVAAAVVTGLIGFGVVNITEKSTVQPIVQIAKLGSNTTTNTILQTASFDEALKNVSDNEIEQYLQKNGHDVSAALVASATDDVDKLPEATEYLLDENVLENYLKKNNLNN